MFVDLFYFIWEIFAIIYLKINKYFIKICEFCKFKTCSTLLSRAFAMIVVIKGMR